MRRGTGTVEERLRLLGSGGENVIPFDHPKFGDRYRFGG